MSVTFNEDANLVTKITPDKELYAVFEGVDYEVIVGDSAKIEVGQAINYIKSGKAEIQEGVDEVLNAFNANATEKTNAFNTNAENKTNDFNSNALNKTNDFNTNATNKTTDFNNNATSKTGNFNDNAADKTNTFNSNASDKTTAFNNNYTDKKDLIDAQVAVASGYADTAKQWAIGDPTEPSGGSAKYWAEEAATTVSSCFSQMTYNATTETLTWS